MPGIISNYNLKNLTTMRCGGDARFFAEPENTDELIKAVEFANENDIPYFILGRGSNVLISDKGYDGLVIRIGSKMADFSVKDGGDHKIVSAGAGMTLASFGKRLLDEGLEGGEFLCGIPGTVGGAVFMNAGAYGREIKDIALSASYLKDGEIKTIDAADMELGYRTSIFAHMEGAVITGFTARLKKAADIEAVRAYVAELKEKRTASQPLDVPSAGSTFKRPEGYFAGKLIQDAGLKGFKLDESGAQVSPKHSGFVVNNNGTAKASDIKRLMDYVSDEVYSKSGVRLEPEIRFIGEFDDQE
ncbi:MAG: UDP-N-acetylmuramate dehydrogenase [Clostridiales bacterium]|nr:UDP-N-acetylmuramate dehydrogenase [Clostridiales bacterium]